METKKGLYRKTVIDSSDSEELSKEYKMELEYYWLKNEGAAKPYGIQVIKRQIKDNIMNIEDKTIDNIFYEEESNEKLLEILVTNKVTPICVEDVVRDLLISK